MTHDRHRHCLFLLREADRLLMEDGQLIAAAHLAMAIDVLQRRYAQRVLQEDLRAA